ncbi:MAG: energy transducer TonB [Saprospiraceae bacterium]|nr:energy transducer TonB [Saprospiraceae bacterium]
MAEQGARWSPGIQNGVPVRVQYNFPIRFKLE